MEFIMGNSLVKAAVLDTGIQWGLFAVAAFFQTEKFYDLAGSSTFALLAWKSLEWGGQYFLRQKIQTGCVMIWAMRLGLYLFTRIIKDGHDSRFDKVRGNPKVFFIYWTIQALWIFLTLLPTLILNNKQKDTPLSTRDYLGYGMWIVGFLFETIADHQKSVFKSNPENAGHFIQSGLWSISRHPNYFGEIMLWSGLWLSASSTMNRAELFSIFSPAFVAFLLTRVSGIPLLERQGQKKWGSLVEYQQYLRNTAVLVPFIW